MNNNQISPTTIQIKTQLDAVVLTDAYTDDNSFTIDLRKPSNSYSEAFSYDLAAIFKILNLYINYTPGATETSNVLDIQIETGNEDDDLYISSSLSDSSGTITVSPASYHITGATGGTEYKRNLSLDISDRVVKVSFKETGVVTNFGTLTVKTSLLASN